ncbi:lysine--tRNA ligase [Verrucomicrobiota bacterium]
MDVSATGRPHVTPNCCAGDEQRLIKCQRLTEAGYRPYGHAFTVTSQLSDIRSGFAEGRKVRAAGRLMTIRRMGKSIFADLRDGSDRLQVYACKSGLPDKDFDAFALLDSGDFIGVDGELFTTRAGEKTIRIAQWALLAKALRPLPEKWHGLKDVEIRFRQRYLDLIANPEARELFNKRTQVIREIRSFLWDRGFSEVETPMMQPQSGGAIAKPFHTRYEALNTDMVLRIAPELYLKKLLVGGFDRIFELNRSFRNEGISKTHNPEFTMLEVYQAYSDVRGMKELAESLITTVAQKVFGTLQVGKENNRIDLSLPWREITFRDLVLEKMGPDWFDLSPATAGERAAALELSIDPAWDLLQITHEVYEKTVERELQQPTFVTRLPFELVPLAKVCDDDPTVADVFELVIGGKEIAPAYSELNDPVEQRKRFEAQADTEARNVDEDFLLALEHGMPPAGGMGIGIDRLLMILTGAEVIRDVILFPQLRPKSEER